MAYGAKVILDSISAAEVRLTTIEVSFPRIVLAEFNTHRVFSRNAASSRAIPVKKQIEVVMTDPFIPQKWAKNQKGMVAGALLTEAEKQRANSKWLRARDLMVEIAEDLGDPEDLNVHKQWTNRLLEPWMWVTDIVTATEYENFKGLRVSPDAQPDFEIAARLMQEAHDHSTPNYIEPGDWHLPYVTGIDQMTLYEEERFSKSAMAEISAARCGRVSFLTHDGRRDPAEDLGLFGHQGPSCGAGTSRRNCQSGSDSRALWRKGKKGERKGAVFLHNIRRSDNDRFPHDHPWDFTTRILSGGYIEQLVKVPFECNGHHFSAWGVTKQEDGSYVHSFESLPIFRIVNRGAKIRNEAEHTHRVELDKDPYNYQKPVHTWSLVNVGPARRVWGFLTDKGWVDWKTYLGIPQDAPVPEEDQVLSDSAQGCGPDTGADH